jgi:dihydroorotase
MPATAAGMRRELSYGHLSSPFSHASNFLREAAVCWIFSVEVYSSGFMINSDAGVLDYEAYYLVFMQKHDLVLNLDGEAPNTVLAAIRGRKW